MDLSPKAPEVIRKAFTVRHQLKEEAASPGRHIFVFLDGTWNEERTEIGSSTPTNVLRMYRELDLDPVHRPDVVAHYYRGVGSLQDNTKKKRLWYGFNGEDEQRIRQAAFADVYRDYRSRNDSIYIIGFSRGAASARLLARDICDKGFPLELTVYTSYFSNLLTSQVEPRVERVEPYGGTHVCRPTVAFLGCWDTVDAFVLPSRFPEHQWKDKVARFAKKAIRPLAPKERFTYDEGKIPLRVQKAVHCVAIDETRNAFLPTLMPYAANVEEVWFPGVHADVGGGYDDNMLAEEPYRFMKDRLMQAINSRTPQQFGVFKDEERDLERDENREPPAYCFHFHGLNPGWRRAREVFGGGHKMRRIRVTGGEPAHETPKIHASTFRVANSGAVFAANRRNKRTWSITYGPYNVAELNRDYEVIETPGDAMAHAAGPAGASARTTYHVR